MQMNTMILFASTSCPRVPQIDTLADRDDHRLTAFTIKATPFNIYSRAVSLLHSGNITRVVRREEVIGKRAASVLLTESLRTTAF